MMTFPGGGRAPDVAAGPVWIEQGVRRGLTRADLTGALGRACVVSVFTHALVIAFSAVSASGLRVHAEPARSGLLQARLRPAPQPSTEPSRARVEPASDAPVAERSAPPADPAPGAASKPNHKSTGGLTSTVMPIDVVPARRYYLPREVDQPAAPLLHAELVYPEEAMKRRIGGVVVMHLFIGPDGALERTEVVRAEPPGMFEDAVREAARKSRFRPALLMQVPVGSRITIEVPFDPNCGDFETCVGPPKRGG